ncbi:Uncharacterized protein HZ326_0040 [Fusarium oxysporum f. sp. albedinis]|nr:Uncharacterized protein HZ326_0040 [Fusarium oxysporum f. sp. albedinis]
MTNERTFDSIGLLECGNGKFQKVTLGLSSGVKNRYFKNPRLRSWEVFKTNVEAQAKPGGSILAQLVPSLNTNQQGSCTSELFPRENTLEALVKQRKACGGDDD